MEFKRKTYCPPATPAVPEVKDPKETYFTVVLNCEGKGVRELNGENIPKEARSDCCEFMFERRRVGGRRVFCTRICFTSFTVLGCRVYLPLGFKLRWLHSSYLYNLS